MKRFLLFALALVCVEAFAQKGVCYTEASDLTLVGKVFPDTPNPYQRMDFTKYGGWDARDVNLLEMSSGIIASFKTDSPRIYVKARFTSLDKGMHSAFSSRGFDLYIKKDGQWLWAGSCAYGPDKKTESDNPKVLAENMDSSMKECIIYLPTYSKEKSVQIGVEEGCSIVKGEIPFRHRICLHGSSYMHGRSTGRAGQTVPGFLTRMTGMQFCSLGVSGDCKMQPQFANALKDADVDAFVFDAFSNGTDASIKENLFPFIETIQASKPGVPLIFISTIWREKRNFNSREDNRERLKAAAADSLMKIAVKKYKDVYYVNTSNATSSQHDTTEDGTHPGDWGYYLWAESIRKPILKILKKYGIK
ncbi:MAG: SGNH/GDSL hydrolase family protein [Bacteroidales bacterium]|nr:SGNH/GDSL hydrolase family protein [Bacteroidales bacterium]MBQ9310732.1 SGNH/GDSL hydrolase family protein [Bacteroidales bacterium]